MPYIFFLLNSLLSRSLGLFLRLIKRNYLTESASNNASHHVQNKVMALGLYPVALDLYPVALYLDHDVLHSNGGGQVILGFVPLSCHDKKLINDAKKPPFIYPLVRTSSARSQRIEHALNSRICCGSTVNYRVELNGNATTRRGSSVETPRSPTGRHDIFILTKNYINLYNLSKFPCYHTAIKDILHLRDNSVWMQPGVIFP